MWYLISADKYGLQVKTEHTIGIAAMKEKRYSYLAGNGKVFRPY